MLPHPISDSIWLAGGTLLIGAGHAMLQYGQSATSAPSDSASADSADQPVGLFEHVAWLNGPLPDYHPQMLLQCLLWGQSHFFFRHFVLLS